MFCSRSNHILGDRANPHPVTAARFDFDHVGALQRELEGCERAGEIVREIENAHVLEWLRRHVVSPGRSRSLRARRGQLP
jgi:hypothetical protein